MSDKMYWNKIAEEWKKKDDGIDIPKIDTGKVVDVNPDEMPFDSVSDDEINDILADLGLDDL